MVKCYRKQGILLIKNLKKQICIIELADNIIEQRYLNGLDRFPLDIHFMISEINSLSHLDVPSIYAVLINKVY